MKYEIVSDHGDRLSVTVFAGGRPLVATKEHPNFDVIVEALISGEDDPKRIRELFDTGIPIKRSFGRALKRMARKAVGVEGERLSKSIEVKNGKILYNDVPIHNTLTDVILRYYRSGERDFEPLVLFLENLQRNPNAHSREHLYRWISDRHLIITDDGCFLAYKKVYRASEPGYFKSASAGHGVVDGVKYERRTLPQKIGSVVSMPREDVTFNPRTHCASGLHVGQWGYVEGFSGDTIVQVKVNPEDVVSVPDDHDSEKMRVCRYELLRVVTRQQHHALVRTQKKGAWA